MNLFGIDMSDKKLLVVVAGVGDTMLSDNSFRKLKNNKEVVNKVETSLNHIKNLNRSFGVINLNYSSDTRKDVDVFKSFSKTKVVDVRLNSRTMFNSANEIVINTHDNDSLLFNGDQIDYLFRPSEYEVILMGIDLHGMMVESIKELLSMGFKVKLLKDTLSTFPKAMTEIKSLFKEENFEFCSYQSIV